MLVYGIDDVIVIFIGCVGLVLLSIAFLIGCAIQFFDWIRRKRK